MHAIQTLAHRAPPATRTRARWQPYNSTPSTARNILLHTPLSASPSQIPPTSGNNAPSRPTPSLAIAQTPKDSNSKEPPKPKGSLSIVDQTVKALCEIWRPQDIPEAFLPPRAGSTNNESRSVLDHTKHAFSRSTSQPSTHQPLCADSTNTALPMSHDQARNTPVDLSSNLATMKCFVHEVLRRSRTSGCVLQTAICYLEAIRAKVPQLLQEERTGIHSETSIPRIITLDELEGEMDNASEASIDADGLPTADESIVNTVRIMDQSVEAVSTSEPTFVSAESIADVNAALPCPLLCPRRAFLASLILASKFTQDKCYSNRAWAKLSGLPPKEIGRCERALGEALDWRLWVGKQSLPGVSPGQRTLSRSQSETCLAMPTPSASTPADLSLTKPNNSRSQSGLRRCATLPAEVYTSQIPRPVTDASSTGQVDVVEYLRDYDIRMSSSDVPSKVPDNACTSGHSSNCSSPSTPGLAYSPSSSESSGGDQTVQMSTYFDEPIQTPAGKIWPWPEQGAQMAILNNAGSQDSCAKSALDLSSVLAPGGLVSENLNIEAGWYPDRLTLTSYGLPILHTVECI